MKRRNTTVIGSSQSKPATEGQGMMRNVTISAACIVCLFLVNPVAEAGGLSDKLKKITDLRNKVRSSVVKRLPTVSIDRSSSRGHSDRSSSRSSHGHSSHGHSSRGHSSHGSHSSHGHSRHGDTHHRVHPSHSSHSRSGLSIRIGGSHLPSPGRVLGSILNHRPHVTIPAPRIVLPRPSVVIRGGTHGHSSHGHYDRHSYGHRDPHSYGHGHHPTPVVKCVTHYYPGTKIKYCETHHYSSNYHVCPLTRTDPWVLLSQGRANEAASIFQHMLKHNHYNGRSRIGYALALSFNGNHHAAIREMRHAMVEDPHAIELIPVSYTMRSRINREISHYRADFSKLPDKHDHAFMISALSVLNGDLNTAEVYIRFAERHGDSSKSQVNLHRIIHHVEGH